MIVVFCKFIFFCQLCLENITKREGFFYLSIMITDNRTQRYSIIISFFSFRKLRLITVSHKTIIHNLWFLLFNQIIDGCVQHWLLMDVGPLFNLLVWFHLSFLIHICCWTLHPCCGVYTFVRWSSMRINQLWDIFLRVNKIFRCIKLLRSNRWFYFNLLADLWEIKLKFGFDLLRKDNWWCLFRLGFGL